MIETLIVNALLCVPVIVQSDDAAFHAAAAGAGPVSGEVEAEDGGIQGGVRGGGG